MLGSDILMIVIYSYLQRDFQYSFKPWGRGDSFIILNPSSDKLFYFFNYLFLVLLLLFEEFRFLD